MAEGVLDMAIAMDFYVGSTHILIHDDFVRGPEETQRILKKVGRDATRAMVAAGTYPGMKTAPAPEPENV